MRGVIIGNELDAQKYDLSLNKNIPRLYVVPKNLFGVLPHSRRFIPLIFSKLQISELRPDFIIHMTSGPIELWPRCLTFIEASLKERVKVELSKDERVRFFNKELLLESEAFDLWLNEQVDSYKKRVVESYSPYTILGDASKERAVDDVARAIQFSAHYRLNGTKVLVLLVGGYGRGEGGVVKRSEGFAPSNNLDVLVIVSRLSGLINKYKIKKFQQDIKKLEFEKDISIDFAVLQKSHLRNKKVKLFHYDFSNGHKVLLGDASVLNEARLKDYRNIDPIEILSLAVNRSYLLLLNNWILRRNPTEGLKALVLRHMAKATIACGDYFLFFKKAFSWSYLSKLNTVKKEPLLLPLNLGADYVRASEFRFSPSYSSEEYLNAEKKNRETLHYSRLVFSDYCERTGVTFDRFFSEFLHSEFMYLINVKSWIRFLRDWGFVNKLSKECLHVGFLDRVLFALLPNIKKIILMYYIFAFKSQYVDVEKYIVDVWQRWGDPNFEKLKKSVESES